MDARIAHLVITLAAGACCTVNIGRSPTAVSEPGPRLRTWTLTRTGAQCFTRLADCRSRWERPECAARRAAYPCPKDRDGAPIELSLNAALQGELGGPSCWLYRHERDIPGRALHGPARGPQSSKGLQRDGRRGTLPPRSPAIAVPCPQT